MIPYFGRAIYGYLNIYHFLALILATTVSYSLPPIQALISVMAGWIALSLIKATVGRPVVNLAKWLRNKTAGTKLERNLDAIEDFLQGGER